MPMLTRSPPKSWTWADARRPRWRRWAKRGAASSAEPESVRVLGTARLADAPERRAALPAEALRDVVELPAGWAHRRPGHLDIPNAATPRRHAAGGGRDR